jgi:hypothetical protein
MTCDITFTWHDQRIRRDEASQLASLLNAQLIEGYDHVLGHVSASL